MINHSTDSSGMSDNAVQDEQSSLTQVSEPPIDPDAEGVKVVFCVRNEKFRLAYFLEYYRKLGVSEFFAIDNDSTDATQSYLLSQPDVHVFHTKASYRESNAGRNWTTELANRYCEGNWCLTLDVDEFFIYPDFERVDLNLLTSYLDRWRYKGVFSIFLDFYSKLPLSKANYKEGSSTFDVCDHFDSAKTYSSFETPNFPYIQIKGGIRQRCFWNADDPKSGPSMRKILLVKWSKSFYYLHSTHSCAPIRLADFTGVVAHFKFMSHFKDFAASEVERDDRVENSADWKVYAKKLGQDDVTFYDSRYSVAYNGSKSLVIDGHMRATNLSFGGGKKIFNSFFRIEDRINAVLGSRSWALTYPIRKLAYKLKLSDHKILIEDLDDENIYRNFSRTYGSIWWDLLVVLRLPMRLWRRLVKAFFPKKNQ